MNYLVVFKSYVTKLHRQYGICASDVHEACQKLREQFTLYDDEWQIWTAVQVR